MEAAAGEGSMGGVGDGAGEIGVFYRFVWCRQLLSGERVGEV